MPRPDRQDGKRFRTSPTTTSSARAATVPANTHVSSRTPPVRRATHRWRISACWGPRAWLDSASAAKAAPTATTRTRSSVRPSRSGSQSGTPVRCWRKSPGSSSADNAQLRILPRGKGDPCGLGCDLQLRRKGLTGSANTWARPARSVTTRTGARRMPRGTRSRASCASRSTLPTPIRTSA